MLPNFTGDEKSEIWPRLSTLFAFEPPSFWNGATYLKCRKIYSPMIGLNPSKMRYSSIPVSSKN